MSQTSLHGNSDSSSLTITVRSDEVSRNEKRLSSASTAVTKPSTLSWDNPDDPGNPRNWANRKRWIVTLVVSLFTFIRCGRSHTHPRGLNLAYALFSPVASSISSPSLPAISAQLSIPPGSVLENMSLSIFVLAYAIGPLFWGPLSEIYGTSKFLFAYNLQC
jgi:hypothetical protein